MGGGAGQKHHIGKVKLATVDAPLHNFYAQLILGYLHNGISSDARKGVIYQRRSKQPTFGHYKYVFRRSFANVTILVQDDGFIEPCQGGLSLG